MYASKAVKDAGTNLSHNMMLESSTFWSVGMALQLARQLEWSSHLERNFFQSNIWHGYIRPRPSCWVESGQFGLNEVMLISWLSSMPISQSIPTRPRRSNTAIKSGRGSIMCCRKPLVDVHPYTVHGCQWKSWKWNPFSLFRGWAASPGEYNGGKLRELLDEHHMAAINTFFPAGATYYGQFGNNSRIDYVCLPRTMLARVESCKVLFSVGKRLQLIPAAGKRDHMPLQCGFRHRLGFESAQPAFMWDRHALAQGVLHGHRRDELLQACEGRLAEFDLHAHCHSTPDTLWHIINTAVVNAAQVSYKQQKKHASDPIDGRHALSSGQLAQTCTFVPCRPQWFFLGFFVRFAPTVEWLGGVLESQTAAGPTCKTRQTNQTCKTTGSVQRRLSAPTIRWNVESCSQTLWQEPWTKKACLQQTDHGTTVHWRVGNSLGMSWQRRWLERWTSLWAPILSTRYKFWRLATFSFGTIRSLWHCFSPPSS